MKKGIITLILLLFSINNAYAGQVDKRWSDDDLYLFSALISSQIADYSQSVKFNSTYIKNECKYLDVPNVYVTESGASVARWYECTDRKYLRMDEANPLVRKADGGFDSDRAIILATVFDTSLFYVGTKYPKWRRPLL